VITDLHLGGSEIALVRLIERLDRGEFESLVVSLMSGGILAERARAAGAEVVSLGVRPRGGWVVAVARIAEVLRRFDPDLVQGWMYHGNLVAYLGARFTDRRPAVVWNIRQSLASLGREKPLTRIVIRLNAWLSRRVVAIINNSETSVTQHASIGFDTERVRIIPNGFDLDKFRPSPEARAAIRREIGVPPDASLVGMLSRYHPVKGHDVFLRAAMQIRRALPRTQFVLAGPGVSWANRDLRARITASGLESSVHLLGTRTDSEALLASLDVLVSASGWAEGFPNVVGEAMATGVPCVVTDTGGSAAVVGQCGTVVAPNDGDALAAAVEEILSLSDAERTALGARARERIASHFEMGRVVALYRDLYQSVAFDDAATSASDGPVRVSA